MHFFLVLVKTLSTYIYSLPYFFLTKIVGKCNVIVATYPLAGIDDDAKASMRVRDMDLDTALFNTWATITKHDDLLPSANLKACSLYLFADKIHEYNYKTILDDYDVLTTFTSRQPHRLLLAIAARRASSGGSCIGDEHEHSIPTLIPCLASRYDRDDND